MDTFIVFTGYGFINSMLEPYMKDYAGASQNQVGTAFFLMGLTYTISSVVSGLVSNNEVENVCKHTKNWYCCLDTKQAQISSDCVSDWKPVHGYNIFVYWASAILEYPTKRGAYIWHDIFWRHCLQYCNSFNTCQISGSCQENRIHWWCSNLPAHIGSVNCR